MTKDEIRALIAARIAGQGTNIDAGNALPPVLEAILDLIGGGAALPDGGTTGQVLTKKSNADGDVEWKDSAGGGAEFSIDKDTDTGTLGQGNDYFSVEMTNNDSMKLSLTKPGEYAKQQVVPSKGYVDTELGKKQKRLTYNDNLTYTASDVQASGSSVGLDAILPDVAYFDGKLGMNLEVGTEKWYGTYKEAGVTYQVYTKAIKIDALPATAGITNYPHGITGIKQILSAYGFGTNGFVLNAPRQNVQDNVAIYQVQKGSATSEGSIAIEVGKDRSSMGAYIVLIYAKNN